MANYNNTSGGCTGRGFADVDPNGVLAKFKEWVVKTDALGGPEWVILYDRSTNPTAVTIDSVVTATNIFTSVAHGFTTGEVVRYSTTGTAYGNFTIGAYYYVQKIDADTFYLCSTMANAISVPGTPVNVSSVGSGTHSIVLDGPYIIVGQSTPTGVNDSVKMIKVGYRTLEAGYIRMQYILSWDDTNKIPRGLWSGFRVHSVDSGDFAYMFIGGVEYLSIHSRISTTWQYSFIDEWTGINGFVEAASVVGELQAGASAGSSVTLSLDTGEASLFTLNHWYYIYDFAAGNHVEYVKVTAIDTGADTITINSITLDYTAGAKIGAYPHRFYVYGSHGHSNFIGFELLSYGSGAVLPYVSHRTLKDRVFFANISYIRGDTDLNVLGGMNITAPDDNGYYSAMRPIITEKYNHQSTSTIDTNNLLQNISRQYGKCKNLVYTYGSMAQMLDHRVMDSKEWLKVDGGTGTSSSTPNHLLLYKAP
jgi:hypothetical protein